MVRVIGVYGFFLGVSTMEGDKSNNSVLAWGASVIADRARAIPHAIKTDLTQGSGPPILREAVKDIRSTIHQVFFGQAEGVGEPGAPLNPLPSEVAELRKEDAASVHGTGKASPYGKAGKPDRLPSPGEVAREKQLYQPPPPERGTSNGQENNKGRE